MFNIHDFIFFYIEFMLYLITRYKSKLFHEFNENHLYNVYNMLFFFLMQFAIFNLD